MKKVKCIFLCFRKRKKIFFAFKIVERYQQCFTIWETRHPSLFAIMHLQLWKKPLPKVSRLLRSPVKVGRVKQESSDGASRFCFKFAAQSIQYINSIRGRCLRVVECRSVRNYNSNKVMRPRQWASVRARSLSSMSFRDAETSSPRSLCSPDDGDVSSI